MQTSGTNIKGTLPAAINWPHIETLDLSMNQGLTGALPEPWASSLTSLLTVTFQ